MHYIYINHAKYFIKCELQRIRGWFQVVCNLNWPRTMWRQRCQSWKAETSTVGSSMQKGLGKVDLKGGYKSIVHTVSVILIVLLKDITNALSISSSKCKKQLRDLYIFLEN